MTQAFIKLDTTHPFTVAQAFISAIFDFDVSFNDSEIDDTITREPINSKTSDNQKASINEDDSSMNSANNPDKNQLRYKKSTTNISAQENLLHVVHFCHLCVKEGKIPPVLYSLSTNTEIDNWYKSLPIFATKDDYQSTKGPKETTQIDSNSDESISSPERKI